jgi:hypothetical protein
MRPHEWGTRHPAICVFVRKPHVSDDETVANMGHPGFPKFVLWLFFFFFED